MGAQRPWRRWRPSRAQSLVAILALLLYAIAYAPSWTVPFRVEELDIYHFYATTPFDPLSGRDWGRMAFWTPFHDFRMLPVAYLWNFVVFALLGKSTVAHGLLSIGLDLTNAALLAHWVALRRRESFPHGWIAGAFFLLLPAKHEIVVWSFFTYKLMHVTLVLGGLIALEYYWRDGRRRALLLGLLLLFLSWFGYEASLPLGLAVALGTLLFAGGSARAALWVTVPVAVAYLAYLLLFALALAHVPELYGLVRPDESTSIGSPGLWDLLVSLRNWLLQGVLLANSGLPLTVDTELIPTSIAMKPAAGWGWWLAAACLWLAVAVQLRWRAAPWRSIAYFLGVGVLANLLVLVGRTATNGVDYLAHFSMYQYLPSLILAAILGTLVDANLHRAPDAPSGSSPERRRPLFLWSVAALLALLGLASASAVRAYCAAQAPLVEIFAETERRCSVPGARVSAAEVLLPFSPDTFLLPPEEHAYHALSLLNGDCIRPLAPRERSSAIHRSRPDGIPERSAASFGNPSAASSGGALELIGAELPTIAMRGYPFAVTLYLQVRARLPEAYWIVVELEGPAGRHSSRHLPLESSYNPYDPEHPRYWPTQLWLAGDFIRDVFAVETGDGSSPAGTYTLWLRWARREGDGADAPLRILSGPTDDGIRLRLGTVELR